MTEEYLVATGGRNSKWDRSLHIDADCRTLTEAETKPATDNEIERYDECTACCGEIQRADSNDWSYQNALREAAREEAQ